MGSVCDLETYAQTVVRIFRDSSKRRQDGCIDRICMQRQLIYLYTVDSSRLSFGCIRRKFTPPKPLASPRHWVPNEGKQATLFVKEETLLFTYVSCKYSNSFSIRALIALLSFRIHFCSDAPHCCVYIVCCAFFGFLIFQHAIRNGISPHSVPHQFNWCCASVKWSLSHLLHIKMLMVSISITFSTVYRRS